MIGLLGKAYILYTKLNRFKIRRNMFILVLIIFKKQRRASQHFRLFCLFPVVQIKTVGVFKQTSVLNWCPF